MIDKMLLDYVKSKREAGFSDKSIKGAMLKGGYTSDDINNLYTILNPTKTENKEVSFEKKNFLTKTFNLATNQSKFFGWIKNENLKESGTYFGIFYGILFVMLFLTDLTNMIIKSRLSDILLNLVSLLFGLIIFIIVHAIIAALFAITIKTILSYFGRKTQFLVNFRILLYSLIPYFFIVAFSKSPIYKWLLIIDVTFAFISINPYLILSFVLVALGISSVYNVNLKKAMKYTFFPLGLLFLVLLAVFFGFIEFNGWFF